MYKYQYAIDQQDGKVRLTIEINTLCIQIHDFNEFKGAKCDREIALKDFSDAIAKVTFGNCIVADSGCSVTEDNQYHTWLEIACNYEVIFN